MIDSIHVGPNAVSRETLNQMTVSGLYYWRMRGEYAPAWTRKVGGLDVAEALYQRHHGYPKHLHGAQIEVQSRGGSVALMLRGGTGWELSTSSPTLSGALRNLAAIVDVREDTEEDRLAFASAEVLAIEATLASPSK